MLFRSEGTDTPQDAEKRALRRMLGTTIHAARKLSRQLNPPPSTQTYSAINKIAARMFFKIFDQHRSKWDVFNYKKWEGTLPIEEAYEKEHHLDLINFLAEHEIIALGDTVTEETLIEEALDMLQFLDIALADARLESPQLQPLPPQ